MHEHNLALTPYAAAYTSANLGWGGVTASQHPVIYPGLL